MSETIDLKNLILTSTWHTPLVKKDLFDAILNELSKLFPPITYENLWFYKPAWNYSHFENYMDFSLNLEYFYILRNTDPSKPLLRQYEKLKTEFEKNVNKIIPNAPSIFSNSDPFAIHIDILKTDESGCEIEIICHPFLYWNITRFKAKIDNIEKQHAILTCERYLKTLAVGLNAKDIDKTESNIAQFSLFMGINQNWMSSTYALQLQEVSITLVAKKKGIDLTKENVEKILNKKIQEKEFYSLQYEAFTKEVQRLYGIEIPLMPSFLRKMRQAVLHEGYSPKENEKELIVSVTIGLLKELKKVYEADKITQSSL